MVESRQVTVQLNALGAEALSLGTKVRIRTMEGMLQLRPTNRTSMVNLPKDEQVMPLSINVACGSFTMNSDIESGMKFILTRGTYGWFNTTPTHNIVDEQSGFTISAV